MAPLDYAHSENALVRIEGESRFGKTERVKTWCAANPGKARLVFTPSSSTESDLVRAVVEALGIDFGYQTPARQLRETVEYILRHSRLMVVFDEAHFLFPTRFTANTTPMRLNWVRTQIVDRQCGCALISTPQDYGHSVTCFVKATGHNIQQFLGRIMMERRLPSQLDRADLLAVAQVHFPGFDPDVMDLIIGRAMASESYLMALEAIAKRARFIAKRDGHSAITLVDLDLAMSELVPDTARLAGNAPGSVLKPRRAVRGAPATPQTEPRETLAVAPPDRRGPLAGPSRDVRDDVADERNRLAGLEVAISAV